MFKGLRPSNPIGKNIGLGVFDLDPAHDGEVIVLSFPATKPSWRGRLL